MTNVTMDYADLVRLLRRPLPREELEARLPMMGCAFEGWEGDTFTLDVFADRPDWYSVEGLARSLRGFLGIESGLASYPVKDSGVEFRVESGVERVRPFAVGGFVRGIALDETLLKSLIDLQEKLHTTLGRKRKKVAIGIHDAARLVPPFTYRGVAPDGVRFVPLGESREMTPAEILREHEKGREFAAILAGAEVYPMIEDAKGEVLSFPPIINGTVTQLTPQTRDLFLDVTGTDWPSVNAVLNILATALAERGGSIETVRTVYADGAKTTPYLHPRPVILDLDYASALLGVALTTKDAIAALTRMRYDVSAKGGTLTVLVPPYRGDVMHVVDIVEDIAIGHGYERIAPQRMRHATLGAPAKGPELERTVRGILTGYGFQEAVTLTLAPRTEPLASPERVAIRNPISEEVAVVRSALLPGLLALLRLNKHRELPQRVFEVGSVVLGGRNVLHLAAAVIHAKASFTEAKSLVQSTLRDLGRTLEIDKASDANYIPGRCASILLDGKEVGRFGEVHPRVIEGYELKHPVVAFEMDLTPI